uniref:Uncharacterized protein n=1 Tax=Anguilla anguilla TaxID=7936 RepID=A0A0E9WEJ3_ANGAN
MHSQRGAQHGCRWFMVHRFTTVLKIIIFSQDILLSHQCDGLFH